MRWVISFRADPAVRVMADRHYSRQSIGSPQFVPPGQCVVLRTLCGRASWVTLSQRAEYVKHAWPLAWNNSLFRNDGAGLSSELKRDPGRCYLRAGFRRVGVTKGGLIVLQLLPHEFPDPQAALGSQMDLAESA